MLRFKSGARRILKATAVGVFALCALIMTGCEDKEENTLAEAQECLDRAVPGTADSCIEKVSGLTSPESYLIRCSARYIKQGFTTERFAKAFENLKNKSGDDPMLVAMTYLTFASKDDAQQALSDCQASGVKGMIRLAALTHMATVAVTAIANAVDPSIITAVQNGTIDAATVTQIKNNLDQIAGQSATDLGQTAIVAHEAYCAAGSSFATNEICVNLGAALAANPNDPAVIGDKLKDMLKNNSGGGN